MRNFIYGLLAIAVASSTVSATAQTPDKPQAETPAPAQAAAQTPAPSADEIVAKYIEAIGGKDAISKVKSMVVENAVEAMGNESTGTTELVDGVGYKSEVDFNGTKIIQCYTDKGGWSVNPMAGATDPTPMPDDVYNAGKGQIYVGGPLFDYAAKDSKIEYVGKDGNNYKIKLTTKENVEQTYKIDATSYLVNEVQSKGKMQDQEVDITMDFSDYRKTDGGYMIPYSIAVDFGGQFTITISVKKVELNKTIDPSEFAMSKGA